MPSYYRGGPSLKPRSFEVKVDPITGLLQPTHGISVFDRPDNLDRFGGAYRIANLPEALTIIQRGRDPGHHEIVPSRPMSPADYEDALSRIVLVRVS